MIVISILSVMLFLLTRKGRGLINWLVLLAALLLLLVKPLGWFRYLVTITIILFDWLLYPFELDKGLSLFFGVPASGKTTLCAYLCKHYKGRVYSNVPIKGALKIDRSDIGKFDISNGMLLIDEAGIDFNNRFGTRKGSSMALNEDATQWLKLYRHYKIDKFACFSQRVDIDVTIRGLADRVYLLKKTRIPYIVVFVGVKKVLTVDVPPNSNTGQLVDGYKLRASDFHMIWTPPLWKMFDTYDAPIMPKKEYLTWDGESKYSLNVPAEPASRSDSGATI